ncbi:hypothetical protein KY334_02315 [Candidatus Woesearchaeota archaeon]|nr:hypothetical protein [Candidatus Woesearchaeota archaeon]
MGKPEQICKLEVVFQDPFHLKNLYKFIKFWLEDKKFITKSGPWTEKNMEVFYSEQDRGGVKEYHIWWKTGMKPTNSYFRYYLDINYLGLGVKNTEVIKDDKKYKLQIGEITIKINSYLEVEANGSWDNHWFLKYFQKWFQKKWYRVKIEQHEDELYELTYKLQKAVKEYLELRQYEGTPDLFYFPAKGME